MAVIAIRTVIFYIVLTVMIRLMGKRQIGQLETSDLVSAMLISELAALPMTDRDIPLIHGLISVVLVGCIEIIISYLCRHVKFFKKCLCGEPILLAVKGKLCQSGLDKARITSDEVMASVRSNGYASLDEVAYVILEQTGAVSVIAKSADSPLTPRDVGMKTDEKHLEGVPKK